MMTALAGWSNRQQQEVIEFLRTENQILPEDAGTQVPYGPASSTV